MPLYEYKCKSCGKKEEKLEKFGAPAEQDCPICNTELGMHRQVSLTSFLLAGGGWMAHGYEDKKSGNKKKETTTTKTTDSTSETASSACPSGLMENTTTSVDTGNNNK